MLWTVPNHLLTLVNMKRQHNYACLGRAGAEHIPVRSVVSQTIITCAALPSVLLTSIIDSV